MSVIYRYLLIVVACIAVLFGIQIPNFVDQYEKRLDAHYLEVSNNLRGYQEIANRYHGGSIEALIKKHEESEDSTFKEEAKPIRNIFERFVRFRNEMIAMNTVLAGKVFHLVTRGDKELIDETYKNYSASIPLNNSAVVSGFVCAALLLIILEVIFMAGRRIARLTTRSTRHAEARPLAQALSAARSANRGRGKLRNKDGT